MEKENRRECTVGESGTVKSLKGGGCIQMSCKARSGKGRRRAGNGREKKRGMKRRNK